MTLREATELLLAHVDEHEGGADLVRHLQMVQDGKLKDWTFLLDLTDGHQLTGTVSPDGVVCVRH